MNTPRFPLAVRGLLTVVALLVAEVAGALPALALSGASDGVLLTVASTGVTLAAFGLAVLLVRFVDRRPVAALRLRIGRAAMLGSLLGLALIAAAVTAATGLAMAFGLTDPSGTGPGWSPEMFLPVALVQAFVLQAFPEELLFRGYLVQTALGRLSGPGVFALSTLLFAAIHLVSGSDATTLAQRLQFLLIPLGFGALATVLRMTTDSLWPAVAVHGGFHTTVYVLGGWVTPSPDSYGLFGATLCAVAAAVTIRAGVTGRLTGTGPAAHGSLAARRRRGAAAEATAPDGRSSRVARVLP
jgi:membrane protease YdiL (CAAX protease family)